MAACIAFLLDADNLNDAAAVREALAAFEGAVGKTTIRRAYGSAETLRNLNDVLAELAVRPVTNFGIEKNTTDVALAVDATEIAFTMQPQVVGIGSGDADFFPLAVRLRERGIRVIGYSLHGKMSRETAAAYDEVNFVGSVRAPAVRAAAKVNTPSAPAKKTAAKKLPAKKAAAKAVPAKKATPAKSVADKAPEGQALLDRILELAPRLRQQEPVQLGEVAKLLHDAKLLGKNAPSSKLFAKFPAHFELMPTRQPNQVRWTGRSKV